MLFHLSLHFHSLFACEALQDQLFDRLVDQAHNRELFAIAEGEFAGFLCQLFAGQYCVTHRTFPLVSP